MTKLNYAKGVFKRDHPNEIYKRDGLPVGWFSIRHDHFGSKTERRNAHGNWCKIKSKHATIYRVPRFNTRIKKSDIYLDYQGWLDLNSRSDKVAEELELSITILPWWKRLLCFYRIINSYPDPAYRLSGLIAIYLGSISVVLGLISICMSLY